MTDTPTEKIEESLIDWKNDPSGANRVVIRPEVAECAIKMEKVLRKNGEVILFNRNESQAYVILR